MYSYFSILSYNHNSLLIFCSSTFILPSSCTSSSIKSTTCDSRFFFTCCATRYWRSSNITSCRTSRGMWVTTSEFAGKDNNEIVSCRYSLVYFPREVFAIMYEDLLYGYYSLPFKFSGKVLTATLIFLFFSFISNMSTRLFWMAQTKII